MTDNKDRFVTPLPNSDDRSPDTGNAEYDEAVSAEAEEFLNDVGDIPATPEWEKAFAAYAKDQAPDLMPRILEQINRNADAGKAIGGTTEPPKARRKSNRFRIITSLSGVAAAVIVVGILIILNNRLPKNDNLTHERDSKSPNYELTPTAVTTLSESDDPVNTPGGKEQKGEPFGPVGEPTTSVPTPTPLEDERRTEEPYDDDPRENRTKEDSLRLLEKHLKKQSLFFNKDGSIILHNASVGESVVLNDDSTACHLYIDGTDSGCLILWPEAETGKTYSEITFQFGEIIEIGDTYYHLFNIVEWKE